MTLWIDGKIISIRLPPRTHPPIRALCQFPRRENPHYGEIMCDPPPRWSHPIAADLLAAPDCGPQRQVTRRVSARSARLSPRPWSASRSSALTASSIQSMKWRWSEKRNPGLLSARARRPGVPDSASQSRGATDGPDVEEDSGVALWILLWFSYLHDGPEGSIVCNVHLTVGNRGGTCCAEVSRGRAVSSRRADRAVVIHTGHA